MNDLQVKEHSTELAPISFALLEKEMLSRAQVECPLIHRFSPGLYIRELYMAAGTFGMGHKQRYKHLNVLLKGKVVMVSADRSTKILEAPMVFVGEPGQKVGLVLEDMVWQNIFPTEETNIEKLEEMLFDKSETWFAFEAEFDELDKTARIDDVKDFQEVEDSGSICQTVKDVFASEITDDECGLPVVRRSNIHGNGVFVSYSVEKDSFAGIFSINGYATKLGAMVNHSKTPNTRLVKVGNNVFFVANDYIFGCTAGSRGDELTINYRLPPVLQEFIT